MKRFSCLLTVFATLAALAENPMNFREYTQEIQIVFKTQQEAQNAVFKTRGLPDNYTLHCSARWDDSTLSHLTTHRIMSKNNVPGTFYMNDIFGAVKRKKDYAKTLLTHNSTLGLHTVTHPHLPTIQPYEHFREYMLNKIHVETCAQTLTNSQALPFCQWTSCDPKVSLSIGWAMRASGVISSPDVMYPSSENRLGYLPNSLAQSKFFSPNDRAPSLERFEKQLKNALANKKALEIQPSITLGIHSWHPKETLPTLDECFARLAKHKEWWFANQNDYGAYRYEALNAKLKKTVNDNVVTLAITRFEPFELGANVPLWLTVENATPTSIKGANLKNNAIELPHDTARALPTVFGYAKNDKAADQIPFATLKLTRNGLNFNAEITNSDKSPLQNVAFTFRFPANCNQETLRTDLKTLEPGKTHVATVAQSSMKEDLYYKYGRPYYAVQVDFTKDNVKYRLFADLHETADTSLPPLINDAWKWFEIPADANLAQLSTPGASLDNLTPINSASRLYRAAPGTIVTNPANRKDTVRNPNIVVVDFIAKNTAPINLLASVNTWHKEELWLNGKKISLQKASATFTPEKGTNRLVFKRNSGNRSTAIFFNGETTPCVEFIK